MKRTLIVALLLFFGIPLVFGQGQENFLKNDEDWKDNRQDVFAHVGATGFLGDLGGLNRIGTNKSPVDLDFKSLRFDLGLGYRYRFHKRFAASGTLSYAMFSGNDQWTEELIRNSRNLSFRSHIVEISGRLEWLFYFKDKQKAKESPDKEQKSKRNGAASDFYYIFTGISGFYFQPQSQIDGKGKYYNLRPLKTEGQGMPGGAKPYGPISWGIPVGIGFRIGIDDRWRLGMEISYTKTFTDYLDDVSSLYFDPNILETEISHEAAVLSNQAVDNQTWFKPTMQRGQPREKDAYVYVNVTVTRDITTGRAIPVEVQMEGQKKF